MMMIAMGTYHWPLRRALRPWVALGAHGSLVCACGVVWAPFARGLVCFFMKTLQKAWKSRKWEVRTRVPVLRTRVPNFGHIYRHAIETPEGGRLDLIFSKFSLVVGASGSRRVVGASGSRRMMVHGR